MSDRLVELAKRAYRYKILDCGQGVFEVFDGRRLLDSLLQWQAVLPFDEETGLSDFEELCQGQSCGPKLNKADEDVLDWLMENVDAIEDEAGYFGRLYQAAIIFEGNEAEVGRFLLAKLYLRL
jgi:hypothetical protein